MSKRHTALCSSSPQIIMLPSRTFRNMNGGYYRRCKDNISAWKQASWLTASISLFSFPYTRTHFCSIKTAVMLGKSQTHYGLAKYYNIFYYKLNKPAWIMEMFRTNQSKIYIREEKNLQHSPHLQNGNTYSVAVRESLSHV